MYPDVTVEHVDQIITSTLRDRGMNRVSQSSLDQIKTLESGEIDDVQALSQWRADILGDR